MNKDALIAALDALIAKKQGAEKIIVQLTKQVWQIDWTVAPFDIVGHYLAFDIPYFYRFMQMDIGDEAEEKEILVNWIETRNAVTKEAKAKIPALIEEINQIKLTARNA